MGTTFVGVCPRWPVGRGGQETGMCSLLGAPPRVEITNGHPDECGDPSAVRNQGDCEPAQDGFCQRPRGGLLWGDSHDLGAPCTVL